MFICLSYIYMLICYLMFIRSLDNHRIFSFCLFPLSSSLLLPHLAGWTRVYDNLHTLSDTLSCRTNPLLNFKPAFYQSQFIIYYEMSLSISGLLLRKIIIIIIILFAKLTSYIKNKLDTTLSNRLTNVQRCCNSRNQP